jgi:hypothetical protein
MQVNIKGDTNNCGACGTNCTSAPDVVSATCSEGTCAIPAGGCATGFGNCDGNATNGCEVS